MSENTANLAAQLKAFYKTGYKFSNHISPAVLERIIRLCKELERLPLLLQQRTRAKSATLAQKLFPDM
jgi:hypothetical protein